MKISGINNFANGIINYHLLISNSYFENYNRRIKSELCKLINQYKFFKWIIAYYLFGRSKVKIAWLLFLKFIKNEEEYFLKGLMKIFVQQKKKIQKKIFKSKIKDVVNLTDS